MIKYFCDKCGKEIVPKQVNNDAIYRDIPYTFDMSYPFGEHLHRIGYTIIIQIPEKYKKYKWDFDYIRIGLKQGDTIFVYKKDILVKDDNIQFTYNDYENIRVISVGFNIYPIVDIIKCECGCKYDKFGKLIESRNSN